MTTIDFKELRLGEKLSSHLRFTNKVRDFVKERADLERDFAKRLETLVKRHAPTKRKSAEEVSGNTENTGIEEWASTTDAWERIISDTLEQSKLHGGLADMLIFSVADKLKALSVRKDESRKKHLSFCSKYKAECEKYALDLTKCKSDYDAACDAVEAARMRYERAGDERTRERLKKLWHQDILDMNNRKNVYLLSLEMINSIQERQSKIEIPQILKQFENFGTSCNSSILRIWKQYVAAQTNILKSHIEVMDGTKFMIDTVDPTFNTNIEVSSSYLEQQPFQYVPCGLWTDEPEIAADEYSVVYLGNKLERLKRAENQLTIDISKAKTGLEGLEKLYQSFVKNPLAGNAEVILESMIDEKRTVFMLELEHFKYQILIKSIISRVGEFPKGSVMHQFKNSSFAIPTTCDYCHQTIWGVAKAGLSCKRCRFNCHLKCEMKVAPTCSEVKGIIRNNRRSVSDTFPKDSVSSRLTKKQTSTNGPAEMKEVVATTTITKEETDQETDIAAKQAHTTMIEEPLQYTVHTRLETVEADLTLIRLSAELQNHEFIPKEPINTLLKSEVEKSDFLELQTGSLAQVLYDYFATNPEEVNIHEGEHVIVVKTDGGAGWTLVNKAGITGIVPTSYIRGIASDSHSTLYNNTPNHDHGFGTALYSYTKNSSDELSVLAGDTIKIVREDDGSGWVLALTRNGQEGLVPAAYVIKM